MLTFFKNLHIDLGVAIGKRENFDATIDLEAISAQDIDFFDVAIDKNSDENSEKDVVSDSTINFDVTFFERSRTVFGVEIARDKDFGDEKDDEIIDRDDETEDFDSKEDETTNSTDC